MYSQSLDYFVGKVCTITTMEINFRFKPEQMMDYCMGTLESIDDNGIMLVHIQTKCKTYIMMDKIVSIAEEQVLLENNPDHAKIIEDYRKEKPVIAAKTVIPSNKIDPAGLAELARKAKENYAKP